MYIYDIHDATVVVRAGNFGMVDIRINSCSSLFANLKTNIVSRLNI